MIHLETNALVWLLAEHARAGRLASFRQLAASPAALLELGLLAELGKIRPVGLLAPFFT